MAERIFKPIVRELGELLCHIIGFGVFFGPLFRKKR